MPFDGDFRALEEMASALDKLKSEGLRRASKASTVEGQRLIQEGFDKSISPLDIPWIRLKQRQGKPLVLTGKLQGSMQVTDNGKGFSATSPLDYASVHQFGAKTRKPSKKTKSGKGKRRGKSGQKKASSKRGKIPARPFLPDSPNPTRWVKGLSEAIEKETESILEPIK